MKNNYLFYDEETGEEFFVQRDTKAEAVEIAKMYFTKPLLQDCLSDEEADILGYDTY